MKVTALEKLPDVKLIEPRVFEDSRGFFLETYQQEKYEASGINVEFVQDNLAFSDKNILRGLHYQIINPQGKLVYAVQGEIYDVAVDIRKGSPTFGVWEGFVLSADNKKQAYIPAGFAHGYFVVSATASVIYKCSDYYTPAGERGVIWNDPALAIDWPAKSPIISDKDSVLPLLAQVDESDLPEYR